MADIIPYGKPFIAGRELEYIAQAVKLGHLSGDGQFTDLSRRWFIERLGCRHALLTHSCTAALELAAIAAGIGEGDEVIMASFTFVSTANAFVLRGARPVFVDIRRDTLGMDIDCVAAVVTPRTRCIVPMHYCGVACEMDVIDRLARHGGSAEVRSALSTPPATEMVLPVTPPAAAAGAAAPATRDFILSPSPKDILEALLPAYVRNAVYRALVETEAGFQSAQRNAMKNATDNATEML